MAQRCCFASLVCLGLETTGLEWWQAPTICVLHHSGLESAERLLASWPPPQLGIWGQGAICVFCHSGLESLIKDFLDKNEPEHWNAWFSVFMLQRTRKQVLKRNWRLIGWAWRWLRTWTLLLWRSGAGFTTPTLGPSKFPELQLQVIEYSHLDSMETFTCMHIPTYSHILHIVYIIKNNESESLKKIPMAWAESLTSYLSGRLHRWEYTNTTSWDERK